MPPGFWKSSVRQRAAMSAARAWIVPWQVEDLISEERLAVL